MASSDATAIPIKNQAFRAVFPILDADGDLVTGATGLDSEVSKDEGTFADCTNEATEIATSSGMYYLDLSATEMNADCVAVIVKTSSAGAKTTVLVFYPAEAADIAVNVVSWRGSQPNTLQSGRVDSYLGAVAAGVIAAASFAANALDAVWSTATRVLTANTNLNDLSAAGVRTAVGLASANLDTQLTTIDDFLDTEVAAIKAKTDNLPASPAAVGSAMTLTSGERTSIAAAIWDALLSGISTASSIGKLLKDNIDATISSRLSSAGYTAPPSVGAIADQVWDEALSAHLVAGSTGEALDAAASASIAGPGALTRTIGVTVAGNPVEGASVWLATDAAGTNVIAGPLTSDSMGEVTVLVDAGDYYVWVQKDGNNAIVGQAISIA